MESTRACYLGPVQRHRLQVDFQIQAVTPANAKEPGERHALFMTRPMEMAR